ncbi:MAG: CHAT domain-containing protein [Symploca sp. SIO3E6]|nr:CHAT domain-containing protein [Caldora sp. SIO3E6]
MTPVKLRAHHRLLRLILLAILGLITTLAIPALSVKQSELDITPTPVNSWLKTSQRKSSQDKSNQIPVYFSGLKLLTQTLNSGQINPQSLLQQGRQYYEAEQFSQAIIVWQQAIAAFVNQGDTLNQSWVLSNLSLAYQQLGQWKKAQEAIDQSLKLLPSLEGETNSQTYSEILAKIFNTQGRLQWETGQLEPAFRSWQKATVNYEQSNNPIGIIGSLINQAQALQSLGLSSKAEKKLQKVYRTLQASDSSLQAIGYKDLGNAWRRLGKLNESRQILAEGRKVAELPTAKGALLLELGNTERALAQRAIVIGKQSEAFSHTQAAIEYFQQAFDTSGQIQAPLNQLSLLVETEQWSKVAALLPQIQQSIANLPPSRTAIYAQLNFAHSLTCLHPNLDPEALSCQSRERSEQLKTQPTEPRIEPPSWKEIAQILTTAAQQAQQLEDLQAQSYALGQLGGLYELTQQWSDAHNLTQQALLQAYQTADIRYRWEWQLGRIAKKQGDIDNAIAYYKAAVDTLKTLRQDLLTINSDVRFSFRDNIEPLYRAIVDLLLRTEGNSQPPQENLKLAIGEIDSLQLAELENFLGCDLSQRVQPAQKFDNLEQTAAFIYPIILEDKLAVISKLPGQPLKYHSNLIERTVVEKKLRKLRKALSRRDSGTVREIAKDVYQWLIEPLEAELKNSSEVETLVFALDGDLRNIPMSVLYDQKKNQYLIEKQYSLVLSPNAQLFELQTRAEELQVLGAGISEEMQIENRNFLPLNTTAELQHIQNTLSSEILLNSRFTKSNVEQKLNSRAFSVVHLATHGKFSSDPEETYILAYNQLLRAQDLHKLLQSDNQKAANTIELLVLSACKTAEGDNRATLGLAGLAVRAGVRSTLATLWQVGDQSTVKLMEQFYNEFNKPGVNKAEALHRAQQALLNDHNYQNPSSWAPYILVGNWR